MRYVSRIGLLQEGGHGLSGTPIWVPPHIANLSPYKPGKPAEELEREYGISGAVKVASNENPLGPSPVALEAASLALAEVNRYPDSGGFELKKGLADKLGASPDRLVLGGGCNEIIHMLVGSFCQPGDEVLSHQYAFISYKLAAVSRGVAFVEAPVTDTLGCDFDKMIERINDKTRLVFVANPNNPTGQMVSANGLRMLIKATPKTALVVIDEAYFEYAQGQPGYAPSLEFALSEDRVVLLRTFSKAYGLAGLRVGFAVMPAELADVVERIRRPFNANMVAQSAALAALTDEAHVIKGVEHARVGVGKLTQKARSLGLVVHDSFTNFVLVETKQPAADAYEAMLRKGVIVRPMAGWGLPQSVRISVGNPSELEKTLGAMDVLRPVS